MPSRRSNLPLFLAAGAALASAALLAAVVARRSMQPAAADRAAEGPATSRAAAAATVPREAAATETILASAETLVRQGKHAQAETVLTTAVREQPEDQELRLALAGVLVLQSKLAAAYEHYEAALAIGPRTPEVEFTAGTVASRLDRLDRAEEHFSAAQAGDTSDPRFPLYLAQVQMKAGQTGAARKNLLIATRLDENLAIAWGSLAELSLREGEPNVALQVIGRARDLEPAVTAWRVIEARALNRLRRADEALAVLAAIPDAERRQLPVLRLIGESCGLLGRPERAVAEFEAAAAANPDDGDLLFDLAVWCERAGQHDKAARFARRAADLGVEAGAKMAERLSDATDDPG